MSGPPADQVSGHGASFPRFAETDPARSIIITILELVPASHWTFTRFKRSGEEEQHVSAPGNAEAFRGAEAELAFEGQRSKGGPGIGATAGPLGRYSSGLTLVFADSSAKFGILTLLRSEDLGPFTSSEIRTLTFALDAASDRFSELRLMEAEDESLTEFRLEQSAAADSVREAVSDDVAQYILNDDLEIVLAWTSENERRVSITPLHAHLQSRLPLVLEDAVRALTAAWTKDTVTRQPGIARPVPFLVLRTRPMGGPTGLFIGVSVERFKPEHSLTGAAARFRISPREVQVLALLLDGTQLDGIAERLHIASSTVQDHIKSLLAKTATENRSEMIAKILGWS